MFANSNTHENVVWMDEDSNAHEVINTAISKKWEAKEEYIQLILWFASAIKCVAYWNKSRDLKVTKLLTVSDEAFIIVCLISYGAHWITMHKNQMATQVDSDALQEKLLVSAPVRDFQFGAFNNNLGAQFYTSCISFLNIQSQREAKRNN